MRKEDCYSLGIIARKHSFKGEVVIVLDTDEPELYQDLESVFVQHGANLIPFFIEKSLLQKGNQLRVKFEGIDSETDAESILKSGVYLPLSTLPKLTGNQFYFHEVIGFTLVDTSFGKVGEIVEINDNSAQELFVVQRGEIELLIPMIDDVIQKIDREQNQVVVTAPQGLIEMYLED